MPKNSRSPVHLSVLGLAAMGRMRGDSSQERVTSEGVVLKVARQMYSMNQWDPLVGTCCWATMM